MSNTTENTPGKINESAIARAVLSRERATLDTSTIENLLEGLRTKTLEIAIGNTSVTSVSWLGSGGSKTVHDVKIDGNHYALSLPNAIHDAPAIMERWKSVLDESIHTDRLRGMGFFTNSLSAIVQTAINGIQFPAVIMRRYRDLPFEVRDNKNPISSIGRTRIIPKNTPGDEVAIFLLPLAEDIRNLVTHNVGLERDSINLCVVDGKPRLYFNDLGSATFENIPEDMRTIAIRFYAGAAIGVLISGVVEQEYAEYQAYLNNNHDELCEVLCVAALKSL